MGPYRIVGLGSALVDLLYPVSEEFLRTVHGGKGGTEPIDASKLRELLARLTSKGSTVQGGSTANSMVALAHLGTPGSFVARIGRDENGAFFRKALEEAGVDVSGLKVDPQLPTGCCLSLITPDSERTMRTCLGADATMGPDDVLAEDFAGATHIFIEGYSLRHRAMLLKAAELASATGMEMHFDLGSPELVRENREFLLDFIPRHVFAVYANEMEAQALSGETEPAKALDFLEGLCRLPIVKLGKKGVILKRRGEAAMHVPAKEVHAIDTTAAGDLWAAGFLHGYLSGWSLERAAQLGALVSAEVVQVVGSVLPEAVWQRLRRG